MLFRSAPQRQIALVWRKTFPRFKAIALLRDTLLGCNIRGVRFLPDAPVQSA